jgi:Icc-related predicted phosphoesterase
MKILLSSDLHGLIEAYLNFKSICINEKVNLGIVAGDLTTFSSKKIEEDIKNIFDGIGIPILFIMGNDDQYEWEDSKNAYNINQKTFDCNGYRFIGYQFTNPFIGGIFEKNEYEQRLDFSELKKLCNNKFILITHGPPFGILDKVGNKNVGSKALLNFIQETKPEFHFFGHIHEQAGIFENNINGAYPIKKEFYLLNTEDKTIRTIR